MPIIEELSDSNDDNSSSQPPPHHVTSEQQASAALDKALHIVRDEAKPIEARYHEILLQLTPLEIYFPSAPPRTVPAFEERILTLLRPHPALVPSIASIDDDDAKETSPALSLYHTLSVKLLRLLKPHTLTPTVDFALTVSSLTNPDDAFTSTEASTIAISLLNSNNPSRYPHDIVITGILKDTIKPLFTHRTVSATRITPAGRLAIRDTTANADLIVDNLPWSTTLPSVMAVLEWVISTGLTDADLETAWPLLIPPILSINDSHVIKLRTRGIGMITMLLKRLEMAKNDLLRRTGLGGVLWEAVERGLGYFPPLTAVKDCVAINRKATECLRLMARVREPEETERRAALLDRIVREGFVKGMVYAGEKLELVEVLVNGLNSVIEDMGVWAVRHLQAVLPLLSEILGNPFGTTYLPLLHKTLQAEQTAICTCWPRLSEHVPELLHGISACWAQILEDEQVPRMNQTKKQDLDALKTELRKTAAMVEAVMIALEKSEGNEASARWHEIKRSVIEVDPGFEGLFEGA
ncbi:hypothetical protein EX30DRAFT_337319 [Ascodesmis nigricans]|uniref:ARM repeat-containing protein n=1 Tax=Ascodesmis nigricans TaxID=341454 RepID=A0A4S2N6G0_9PEZI|nr:hypothetical protein EX30DRAFT_337319 [Ascodesmis nigricans]